MIIIAHRPGQLANRLILFANFIAFSLENQVRIYNPSFGPYSKWFVGTSTSALPQYPNLRTGRRYLVAWSEFTYFVCFYVGRVLDKLNIRTSFLSCTYLDWSDEFDLDAHQDFGRKGIHIVQGWLFRSPKNMKRHTLDLREYFSLGEPHRSALLMFEDRKLLTNKIKVGVHIRHGDYQTFEGGKYYFSEEVYNQYMDQVKELLGGNVLFVICTNNPSLNMNAFPDHEMVAGPGHPVQDLYTLAKCDYIIGPPSTFSMWASFYGGVPLCQLENENIVLQRELFKVVD